MLKYVGTIAYIMSRQLCKLHYYTQRNASGSDQMVYTTDTT